MSKFEFFDTLHALKKQESNIKSDIDIFLNKKENINMTYKKDLQDCCLSYCEELCAEQCKFSESLKKTTSSIHSLRIEITKPSQDVVNKLRGIMTKIEAQINDVKKYQKSVYDSLVVTESSLTSALSNFTSQLSKYDSAPSTFIFSSTSSKVKGSNLDSNNLHPAVVEFTKYEADFGKMGGWGDFEHQQFTKNFNKSKTDEELLEVLRLAAPLKCDNDILHHITWYRKFRKLESAKRQALLEWKEQKQNKNKAQMSNVNEKNLLNDIEKKKKVLIDKDREERLAQLNAYKVQKELEKVMREEEMLKEKMLLAERENRQKEYQKKQKEKILKYKQQKDAMLDLEKANKLEEERTSRKLRKVTQDDIMRLHEKNMKTLEQKQNSKHDKIVEEFMRQQKLEKLKGSVQVNVKRDPNRLLRKTKGQINRERDCTSNVNPIVGSRLMPHRAMPAWRKGL